MLRFITHVHNKANIKNWTRKKLKLIQVTNYLVCVVSQVGVKLLENAVRKLANSVRSFAQMQ